MTANIPLRIRILLWSVFCMVIGAFIQAVGDTDGPLWVQIIILGGVTTFTYLSFDKLFSEEFKEKEVSDNEEGK